MKRGFTLIELLVVVLIIGILSAVALPQYTKAVEKSRAAEALQMLRYIHQQKEIFALENKKNEGDFFSNEDMGIELGNDFNCVIDEEETEICCNKHWCYENSGVRLGTGCVGLWNNVVATRTNDADPSNMNEERLYYLEYENTPCVDFPRIVCYNENTDKDWCKIFRGNGNPI
jgi:prepilin-type N-terminal cleavage/methylation domain-containing protein